MDTPLSFKLSASLMFYELIWLDDTETWVVMLLANEFDYLFKLRFGLYDSFFLWISNEFKYDILIPIELFLNDSFF